MSKKYFYGKHFIDDDDVQSVIRILKSDWLTQGPVVSSFENSLNRKFGSKYSTAVSSGTAALHLAALSLGLKRNDVVLTSPLTFVASSNCILYTGATPDFVDIHPVSYTIDVEKLEDKLKKYKRRRKNVKAVVAIDYAGHPCEWESLRNLADKYNFKLINDNCHALGAKYKGNIKYAVDYAEIVCQSYHPVKHITTGEGGAVLTNNINYDKKVKMLRTHGITRIKPDFKSKKSEKNYPWYYEMQELGFNYRITDFQCALGISQLRKLEKFVLKRRKIAAFYNKFFKTDDRFIIPEESRLIEHSYHIYPLQILFDKIKISKINFFKKLAQKNIFCQVHYIPVHLQPYYKENLGFKERDFPVSEEFYKNEVSLPVYFNLENEELTYIAESVFNSIS